MEIFVDWGSIYACAGPASTTRRKGAYVEKREKSVQNREKKIFVCPNLIMPFHAVIRQPCMKPQWLSRLNVWEFPHQAWQWRHCRHYRVLHSNLPRPRQLCCNKEVKRRRKQCTMRRSGGIWKFPRDLHRRMLWTKSAGRPSRTLGHTLLTAMSHHERSNGGYNHYMRRHVNTATRGCCYLGTKFCSLKFV